MNTTLNKLKHYIFNVSIFRRRYIIYQNINKQVFYVKTKQIFTKTYYLSSSPNFICIAKLKGSIEIESRGEFLSMVAARNAATTHKESKQKQYMLVRQVYEE